jgi:hypothetical protein
MPGIIDTMFWAGTWPAAAGWIGDAHASQDPYSQRNISITDTSYRLHAPWGANAGEGLAATHGMHRTADRHKTYPT